MSVFADEVIVRIGYTFPVELFSFRTSAVVVSDVIVDARVAAKLLIDVTPVLLIVTFPLIATSVGTLEPFPTRMCESVRAVMAPVAPVAPVEPLEPAAPLAPVSPLAPDEPEAPLAPDAPVSPEAPAAPADPVAPVAPDAPVLPVFPEDPAAPPPLPVGILLNPGKAGEARITEIRSEEAMSRLTYGPFVENSHLTDPVPEVQSNTPRTFL